MAGRKGGRGWEGGARKGTRVGRKGVGMWGGGGWTQRGKDVGKEERGQKRRGVDRRVCVLGMVLRVRGSS
eukprot:3915540-Rhodomonas_salina.2